MSGDPNKKSSRSFQCRDVLWETFEQMARDLECSIDYLINEAMKQYARQRTYGARTPFPTSGVQGAPQEARPSYPQQAPMAQHAPPAMAPAGAPPPPPGASAPAAPPGYPAPPPMGGGRPPGPPPPPGPSGARPPSVAPPKPPGPPGMSRPAPPGAPPPPPGMGRPVGAPPPPPGPPGGGPPPPPGGGYRPPPAAPQAGGSFGGPPPPPPPPGGGYQQQQQQAAPAPPPPGGMAAPGGGNRLVLYYRGQRHEVNKDRFIIGRGKQSSDLTIKDPNVSRQHAMIENLNGQFFMVDMGSTNGIEFNGQRLQRKPIASGDVFNICDHELRFVLE